MSNLVFTFRDYCNNQKGTAAAEFALILVLLVIPILNAADLAIYAWDKMQLDNAAQVAAQTAWTKCDNGTLLPAISKCTGLADAITAAAQSTSLSNAITVGTLSEGAYCPNSSGSSLLPAGSASDCSSINGTTEKPGSYLIIPLTYEYTPLFPGVSVAGVLGTTLSSTGRMRLE